MYGDAWVERLPLPHGDAGTWATLHQMRRLAVGDSSHPLVVDAAAAAARGGGDVTGLIHQVRNWLECHTRFTYDPDGVELVRSPTAALLEIERTGALRGDCDDVATLAAGLLLALGITTRFRVIGWQRGGGFSHVLAEAWDGNRWWDLDVTRPYQLAGVAPPAREATWRIDP